MRQRCREENQLHVHDTVCHRQRIEERERGTAAIHSRTNGDLGMLVAMRTVRQGVHIQLRGHVHRIALRRGTRDPLNRK